LDPNAAARPPIKKFQPSTPCKPLHTDDELKAVIAMINKITFGIYSVQKPSVIKKKKRRAQISIAAMN
jgi:hypothetical protein